MVNCTLIIAWWSVNWVFMKTPQFPQTVIYYWNIRISLNVNSHAKNKLTSVGVQTKAASAVPCLDSVWYSAIFSFIFVSSHHVQYHKPGSKNTNVRLTRPLLARGHKSGDFSAQLLGFLVLEWQMKNQLDMSLTLQADPPWRWPQTESWRSERCHFRPSQTLEQWLNPSASEKDPPPDLWHAPPGRGRVLTHDLPSAPGSGPRLRGRGSRGLECQASGAQLRNATHYWVHYHPVEKKTN